MATADEQQEVKHHHYQAEVDEIMKDISQTYGYLLTKLKITGSKEQTKTTKTLLQDQKIIWLYCGPLTITFGNITISKDERYSL